MRGKFLITGHWDELGQKLSQATFVNRQNFTSSPNDCGLNFIDGYILFGFYILKFKCVRGGHFSQPLSLPIVSQMAFLTYLSYLPASGEHQCLHLPLGSLFMCSSTKVSLAQVTYGLSFSRPIFFFLLCPELSFQGCI